MKEQILHPSFVELKPPAINKDPRFMLDVYKEYLELVCAKYPHIPVDAFEEWIFPFWHEHISSLYGKINFSKLLFKLESWSVSKIFTVQWHSIFTRVESIEDKWTVEYFYEAYRSHKNAVEAWKDAGTWFKPIWVLDTRGISPEQLSSDVKKPLMLIEGHSRMGALRLHAKHGLSAESHKVWVVHI